MDKETLNKILKEHRKWLRLNQHDRISNERMRAVFKIGTDLCDISLSHADLSFAELDGVSLINSYLRGINLSGAKLKNSNLTNADLSGANLFKANLSFANLAFADLSGANLAGADLTGANLIHADLAGADLTGAIFKSADLSFTNINHAKLINTDLSYANLTKSFSLYNCVKNRKGKILTESIIGYKTCKDNVIVTLEIPRGAIVFSINGDKCRTNKAKVIAIEGANRAISNYKYMSYYVGDEFTIYDFDCRYNVECSTGIHFFMSKEEAIKYG